MTLFGSLKTSFTGLRAQGTKMGAISDNIANVSTVGYKRTEVQFSTLVTERIGKTKFTPGGVTARPLQTVDVRGNIQGSSRSTHIAVEGDGMFIVSEEGTFATTRDTIRYTRSGAFRPDDDGYLRNSALYYLQGYPTNRDGTPARDGVDFDSLDQNFTDLEPVDINRISSLAEETDNVRIKARLPAEATPQITLRDGDNSGALTTADVVAGIASASKADFTSTVQVYDAQGTPRKVTLEWYKLGDSVNAAGTAQSDSTPNEWAVHIDARTGMEGLQNSNLGYTVNVAANTAIAGGPATIPAFNGTISGFVNRLNTTAATAAGGNGLGPNETFVATNNGYNTVNSLYEVTVERRDAAGALVAGSTQVLQFNPAGAAGAGATSAAATGAVAGAAVAGLTYTPPSESEVGLVSFIGNFDESNEGSNLIAASGFATQTLFVKFNGDGSMRNVWTDLQEMRGDVLNTDANGIDDKAIGNRETDAGKTPRQFGIAAYTAPNAGRVAETGAAINVATDATTSNFLTDFLLKTAGQATDTVQPQQTRSPFNEQGSQPLFFELFIGRGTTLGDSLVGNTGTNDTFDGTGLDGINNLNSGGDAPFLETLFIQQDGIRAGTVTGVTVDGGGLVTAIYDNGMTRPIYQLALAKFANYNGLVNESGNVYQESEESGDVLLVKPGRSGIGDVRGGALEQANVDLGSEFTDMIITQQAFTANTRSITTTDEMLTDINNLVR